MHKNIFSSGTIDLWDHLGSNSSTTTLGVLVVAQFYFAWHFHGWPIPQLFLCFPWCMLWLWLRLWVWLWLLVGFGYCSMLCTHKLSNPSWAAAWVYSISFINRLVSVSACMGVCCTLVWSPYTCDLTVHPLLEALSVSYWWGYNNDYNPVTSGQVSHQAWSTLILAVYVCIKCLTYKFSIKFNL